VAEERTLNWMSDRPLAIKVADQASEFVVSSFQVTPYGILVDVLAGASTIRRFVPWQQLTYLQQDVTPLPGSAPAIPQSIPQVPDPPGDSSQKPGKTK
jgi:hypothetical protein